MLVSSQVWVWAFVLLAISQMACSPVSFSHANPVQTVPRAETPMSLSDRVILKSLSLSPREAVFPPDGVPPDPNRDLGFATVFLTLENITETAIAVKIQKVEIHNATDNRPQPFSHTAQEILLKPLEQSKLAFHLTNKTGYVGRDRVKAVVTLQIGDRVVVVESDAVAVDRPEGA
jgi:hypothetical protein